MKKGNIKLATSLFSYSYEWNSGAYTFEQVIAKTRAMDLGTGLEIIGFQSLRGFPYITDAQVSEVKNLLDKYEFEPVCLDANIDVAIRRHQYLDIDETVEYIKQYPDVGLFYSNFYSYQNDKVIVLAITHQLRLIENIDEIKKYII